MLRHLHLYQMLKYTKYPYTTKHIKGKVSHFIVTVNMPPGLAYFHLRKSLRFLPTSPSGSSSLINCPTCFWMLNLNNELVYIQFVHHYHLALSILSATSFILELHDLWGFFWNPFFWRRLFLVDKHILSVYYFKICPSRTKIFAYKIIHNWQVCR